MMEISELLVMLRKGLESDSVEAQLVSQLMFAAADALVAQRNEIAVARYERYFVEKRLEKLRQTNNVFNALLVAPTHKDRLREVEVSDDWAPRDGDNDAA